MARTERKANWQGMNWIRQDKRLAIYLRDGSACVWCGAAAEDGAQLSLDHVTPHVYGGGNGAENLITACVSCNSRRGDRHVELFAVAVADYVGTVSAESIVADIRERTALDLRPFRAEAKALIARRGSAARALAAA